MPVDITTRGYIEVYRDGVLISRHSSETEAIESVMTHADVETNGDGTYELRFPRKEIVTRLRKRVVPFSWRTITASFAQGTASSVNLASFLANPSNYAITYAVVGGLPSGVTLSGATLAYNGTGAAASSSVTFTATNSSLVATSAATTVTIAVVNQAPYWTQSPLPALTRQAGETVSLAAYAADPENGALTWALVSPPAGYAIGASTGVLTVGSASAALTVRVTDPGGLSATTTCAVTVQAQTVTPIFFDSFEYVVERNPTVLPAENVAFRTTGLWDGAKAVNITGSWQGYLYTEYNAARGGRVMVAEVPSASYQTDHYVQYGTVAKGPMPANVWYRFKMYTDPASNFSANMNDPLTTGSKFIYSTPDGSYPVSGGSQLWMLSIGRVSSTNHPFVNSDPIAPADGSFYFDCAGRADGTEFYYSGPATNATIVGHNVIRQPLPGGTWLEIKLHFDMSGAQGIYEMWARPVGATTWAGYKYAEWIGGVTPQFVWPLTVSRRIGNIALRTPSDFGRGSNPGPVVPYTKYYWDDFGIYSSDPG